jgi:micrococcal nuclease
LSLLALVIFAALISATSATSGRGATTYRIDHVNDGDTVVLSNGQRVRLVQIDSPEVYLGTECYGPQASATTKRLLPPGTRVRLFAEPATDRVDDYGRLLRYVVRVRDGLNVSTRLVAIGAAAPYFYDGRRGTFGRARAAREARSCQAPRALGSLPAYAVRPIPRRRNSLLEPDGTPP